MNLLNMQYEPYENEIVLKFGTIDEGRKAFEILVKDCFNVDKNFYDQSVIYWHVDTVEDVEAVMEKYSKIFETA